ncbi:MAG: proton-conducting transporter membrane subunit, partial [Acidobacteriota bacterium]|nr:proton-conducting transporter membrane subunit [Acidobacteriota bacterium]
MSDAQGVIVVAPVLVSLATLLTLLVCPERLASQRQLSLAGAVALLVTAAALLRTVVVEGSVSVAFGGWALPFAIGFTADRLSASFVLLAAVSGLAACGAASSTMPAGRIPANPHVLLHAFVAGACGAFLTADLFNLYVWFEVMLVASLGLITAQGRPAQLDAAYRYLALNVVGTVFLLIGVASIYAATGHLNFAGIRQAIDTQEPGTMAPYVALLTIALLV